MVSDTERWFTLWLLLVSTIKGVVFVSSGTGEPEDMEALHYDGPASLDGPDFIGVQPSG
jgi:hypothetical protein